METIRLAVCGTGNRGKGKATGTLLHFPDVEICAVADPYLDKAEACAAKIQENAGYCPNVYKDHIELFEKEKPDAVFVATSWKEHIAVSIDAMERGIAVACEVGGAYSEEECRALVETQERTKTPFMFMENCCYGKDELLALSMARAGLFGEIVYCHGAYTHDLRGQVAYGELKRHYRNGEYSERNRDNYPTHDLGPIAKILNINRGNRMVSLSSRASKARGVHAYIQGKEELAYLQDREFAQGDIVETLITCENGELINLKLDTTLPTYYSRELTVRGTKGLYEQKLNMALFDGEEMDEGGKIEFIKQEVDNAVKYYDEYLPDIWKNVTPEILAAGHGGMDYFQFADFFDALRNGKEMPIDVYDGAAWMAISYLTEQSIAQGGASVPIPDFTNGAYKTRPPKDVV